MQTRDTLLALLAHPECQAQQYHSAIESGRKPTAELSLTFASPEDAVAFCAALSEHQVDQVPTESIDAYKRAYLASYEASLRARDLRLKLPVAVRKAVDASLETSRS